MSYQLKTYVSHQTDIKNSAGSISRMTPKGHSHGFLLFHPFHRNFILYIYLGTLIPFAYRIFGH